MDLLSGGILEGSHEVDDVRHGLVDGAAEDAGVKVHGATLDLNQEAPSLLSTQW